MEPNINPHLRRKRESFLETCPGLDPIVVDIVSRIIRGTEPFIREQFRGLSVPAEDLALASEFVFGRLKELDATRIVSSQELRRRAVDLDQTAKELRKTFLSLADRHGLILFGGK